MASPWWETARPPGGFIEQCTDATAARPRWTGTLPERGPFSFGPPYGTTGIRLTSPRDMIGEDRLRDCGYSYWNNLNAHAGQPTVRVLLSIRDLGPCLYEVDKATLQVEFQGRLFPAGHPLAGETGEGWYWSFRDPAILYAMDHTHLYRVHLPSRELEVVIDITRMPERTDHILWQWHTSANDRVHSATVKGGASQNWAPLGTLVFREGVTPSEWFPKIGKLDESQLDKSGDWLLIKEDVDGRNGEDNRIIHVPTRGEQRVLLDERGAGGHSDSGYGYMVAADNWGVLPNVVRLWQFDGSEPQGLVVQHGLTWDAQLNHVAHGNARSGDFRTQYAIGSGATPVQLPRNNEIVAFPLDGSLRVLVIAPVMTDLEAPGGNIGTDPDANRYVKLPKANVDPDGEFVIWTSNCGGRRLDAFMAHVPAHLLQPGPPVAPPPQPPVIVVAPPVVPPPVVPPVWPPVVPPPVVPPPVPPVMWTRSNASEGGVLTRTGGQDGMPDAGAVSGRLPMTATLRIVVTEPTTVRYAGVQGMAQLTRVEDLLAGLAFTASGYAEVRARGQYQSDIAYAPGDVFTIQCTASETVYARNGVGFWRQDALAAPLYAAVYLLATGASLGPVTVES